MSIKQETFLIAKPKIRKEDGFALTATHNCPIFALIYFLFLQEERIQNEGV